MIGMLSATTLGDAVAHARWRERVEDVMSRRVLALGLDADVADAAALMRREGARRVLVMEGETLYGVVSLSDVARVPATRPAELADVWFEDSERRSTAAFQRNLERSAARL